MVLDVPLPMVQHQFTLVLFWVLSLQRRIKLQTFLICDFTGNKSTKGLYQCDPYNNIVSMEN